MSGMKPWERDIIEYRPNIGLETHILSVVGKRQSESTEIIETPIQQFHMTPVVRSALSTLGVDMLEEVMATLSRATSLLNRLDSSLATYPAYLSYKKALEEGDTIGAHRIYINSLIDITGNPDFDVYPILLDLTDELEIYLNFLNQELFDGKAEYSDLSIIRREEEEQLQQLVDIESEDLRITKAYQLTNEQRVMIQQMIDSGMIEADSVDSYVNRLANEQFEQGSPRINYEDIATRVQVIATAKSKSGMFRKNVDHVESYVDSSLSTYVDDDLIGSMTYVANLQDKIGSANESFERIFTYHANQSKNAYVNQMRIANRDVREFLDKKMASVRVEKGSVTGKLKELMKSDELPDVTGAHLMMSALSDSVSASSSTWTYVLVEHIGTSDMNANQNETLFNNLTDKRRHQTFYKFTDLVNREYTGSNSEKEMNQFISNYNLTSLS